MDLRIGRPVSVRMASSAADDLNVVREAKLLIALDHTQLPNVVDQGRTADGRAFFVTEKRGITTIAPKERGTLQGLLRATSFLRGLTEAEALGIARSPSPTIGFEQDDGSVRLSIERWDKPLCIDSQADLESQHTAMREALQLVLKTPRTDYHSRPEGFALERIAQLVDSDRVHSGGKWLDRIESASRFEGQAYHGQRLRAFILRSPKLVKAASVLACFALLAATAAWFAFRQEAVLSKRAELLGTHVSATLLEDRYSNLWGTVTPDLAVLEQLLIDGQRLIARNAQVREALDELAQRGRPTGRLEAAFRREIATRRSELSSTRAAYQAALQIGKDVNDQAIEWQSDLLQLESAVNNLEIQADAIQEREFDSARDAWEHSQLSDGLLALQAVASLDYGWLAAEALASQLSVARLTRLVKAQLHFRGGSKPWLASWEKFEEWLTWQDASWDRVRRDLERQPDLVFLGPDKTSGCPEFLHVSAHLTDLQVTHIQPEPGRALVLVLLPGGPAISGEQSTDREEPRFVERVADGANGGVGALARVNLAPFFVAKYEVSQAQWFAWTGTNPSTSGQGAGVQSAQLHPVENLSAFAAQGVLRSFGLSIPSEAQWEYAARAGSEAQWPWGDTEESLAGKANLSGSKEAQEGRGDFHPFLTPVGTFEPNAFGLYDVIGNVKECCAWTGIEYWSPLADADTGIRIEADGSRNTFRGGSARDTPMNAKCAGPRFRDVYVAEMALGGVRPVRTIRAASLSER